MFVAQSGLVLIWHSGLITSDAESGGAGVPPPQPQPNRPQEGGKGVDKLKCTPAPICTVLVTLLSSCYPCDPTAMVY